MCSRQDKLPGLPASQRQALVLVGLMPVSVFTINSDCTKMIIVIKSTFLAAGTLDPVYFHWSGLTVV